MKANEKIGLALKMTGGIQAPFGSYEKLTNAAQAALKGMVNARDILEASKSVYGNFKNLDTLKNKNSIPHTAISSIRKALRGEAFQV